MSSTEARFQPLDAVFGGEGRTASPRAQAGAASVSDDPLAPARGIALGMALGALSLTLIGVILWLVF